MNPETIQASYATELIIIQHVVNKLFYIFYNKATDSN